MTLQNLNSVFKHRSLVLHFRCLLGGLGHHFGSFGGSFWEPKSFILGPWGALDALKKTVLKKTQKEAPRLYPYLHLRDHSGSIFRRFVSTFFLYVFWITFGFSWSNFGSPNGATINIKSIQNSIDFFGGFLIVSSSVFDWLSTLRGTPPQHLFDVDLLWYDPAKFEFWF